VHVVDRAADPLERGARLLDRRRAVLRLPRAVLDDPDDATPSPSVTERTWRSAPCATSFTVVAISPIARPVSSKVVAICCEAAATLAELCAISARILATLARMRL
jgi:hypothetical protein